MARKFRDFAELCKSLEKTSSTLEKRRLISNFLKTLEPNEWKPFILLLTGKILPETSNYSLYVGYSTIKKALETKVHTLIPLPSPSITEVYQELMNIAKISGKDMQARKVYALASLLNRLTNDEKKYLIRALSGEMRVGAVIGLVLQALSDAKNIDVEHIRKAYLLRGDIGELAERLAYDTLDLRNLKPTLFTPIRPMLAVSANNIEEAIQLAGGRVAIETKYDGVRVQIHVKNDNVKIFSRRLTDITESLPEVVETIKSAIRVDEAILEGEVIGIDENERPLPFQDLMKRFRRVKDFESIAKKIPVRLYLFDLLYLNGELLIDKPYLKRYEQLTKIAPSHLLAERIVTDNLEEAKKFYKNAVERGHEGVMVKRLDGPYVMGVRGAYWIKVKEVETIDVVIVGAEWGHGRRKGWLSDYYLAVYDPSSEEFLIVGKTFKGLTDEEFNWITNKLLELKIADEGYRIWVKPEIVVEVAFNEIQRSPKYKSGFALRFARITRFRFDKTPKEATTIDELRQMYERDRLRSLFS